MEVVVFDTQFKWRLTSRTVWEYPTACGSFDFLLVIVVRHTCKYIQEIAGPLQLTEWSL